MTVVATWRVGWCSGDGECLGGMMPMPTVRLAWRSPCASIITPAASLPCHEEAPAPVRHSQYPSRFPRPFATMVLTYGTGGATAALTVVGLCTCGDGQGAGNS